MKKVGYKNYWRIGLIVFVVGLLAFNISSFGLTVSWDNEIEWGGYPQGSDSLDCDKLGDGPRTEEGWIHWVLTGNNNNVTEAQLELSGSGEGFYDPEAYGSGALQFFTPYFELEGLEAIVYIIGSSSGQLIISDYCPGVEDATLEIGIDLEYDWTAKWDWQIDKSVTPDEWHIFKGDTGTSQWTVEVTKEMIDEESRLFGEFFVENISDTVEAQNVVVDLEVFKDDSPINVSEQTNFILGNIAVGADPVYQEFSFDIAFEEGSTYTVEMTMTVHNGDTKEDDASVEPVIDITGDDVVEFTDERNPELNQTLSDSATFIYEETFDCEDEGVNENIATIIGDYTDLSANAEVKVYCYELDVIKDAFTTFNRTHDWEINKSVETENEEFINGTPKIWLYPDKSGDETATWNIEVTYLGFDDDDFVVNGAITISNPAPIDAEIKNIDDVITINGEEIVANIDFDGVVLPYTLGSGAELELNYSATLDDASQGENTVTVKQQNFAYHFEDPVQEIGTTNYLANAEITFDSEPAKEVHKIVEIVDEMLDWDHPDSGNGNIVELGILNADNFNKDQIAGEFSYSQEFFWSDYTDPVPASWEINNTARVIGDDDEVLDEDSAILKINWLDEELTVTKTVNTSYDREHFWDIDKSVETEKEYKVDEDTAKIWLFTDGSGDETATWNIDVTYEVYTDSGFVVFGTIEIKNTGAFDNWDARIIDIVDELAGDEITIYLDEDYTLEYTADADNPIVLEQGDEITLYYRESVDEMIEGNNEVTVTTTVRDYSAETVEIVWGEPDDEINATVNIKDVSDLFGEVDLGTVTAPEGGTFNYTKEFAFADYDEAGSFQYDNTAIIVETGQKAEATLKVNVQDFIYESAWAKGDPAEAFTDNGFSNWGWTNPIEPGTYEMDLWAGAAQSDTNKGTLVGSVNVDYDGDGYVTVEFNLFEGYTLEEYHVYAGYDMFPQQRRGRNTVDTVAPGQYYNDGPFDGSKVYVIAHAVVGMPDPDFGPLE